MFALTLCCALLAAPPDESLQRNSGSQVHMGTKFEIVLYADTKELGERGLARAFARVAELDRIMSDYDSESELSRLSQASPTTRPVEVSEDLFSVISHADQLSRCTHGAFDVTVGPLTKLWRRSRRRKEFPDEDLLREARRAVGFAHLKLDTERRTIELTQPHMRLDLGAIAKGYAGDQALLALRKLQISRALINAGGDIVAGDAPPGQAGWRVGVAPLDPAAPPSRFLRVANAAVATSGDAWQYVELAGTRYSHLLDPRTGLGLTTHSSVTVVAPTGIEADSLASAVSVLGTDAGICLIEQTPGAAALVLELTADQLREQASRRFESLLERDSRNAQP